ncbi:MAG: gamma carbonic anhydrase family protein [Gammaproteobacteria bacterium]|nr:gamma carbonic anhydrase family protein [Gammaproteobacteria bacterium]
MIRSFQGIAPQLGGGVYVDEQGLVLGDVVLGDDCSVWPMAVVRGDVNRIRIGCRTNVQDNAVLHVTHDGPYTPGGTGLVVGDDVTVGHGAILHACQVGNRCLIGMHATVLDRAVLEDECFIAAGSVVTPGKVLKGGYLYRGSPAQPSRELTADERAMLKYSAEHYVRLKNKYLAP